jgi:hypothetical protein
MKYFFTQKLSRYEPAFSVLSFDLSSLFHTGIICMSFLSSSPYGVDEYTQ